MQLSKGIPVNLGLIQGYVFGGRFRDYIPGTRRLVGVKMAAEISHPHDISIPTEDFSVPDVSDMKQGLMEALEHLSQGRDIYVGCMGGIGRTGLFMGVMAKLLDDYNRETEPLTYVRMDPVAYVRQNYISHAIETREQQDYVRTFDTSEALEWVLEYNRPKVEFKEVTHTQLVTPWEWGVGMWRRFWGL